MGGQFASVDLFVKKYRVDIQKLNFNKILNFSSLSKEELSTKNLKWQVVIRNQLYDKGDAVVIWHNLFKQEKFRQHADTKFYLVDKGFTLANQKIVKDGVNKLISEKTTLGSSQSISVATS